MPPSHICMCVGIVPQSCPTLWDPMDCSRPGSSVHEIVQARRLEGTAIPSSGGSAWRRDGTGVSCICLLHWQVDSLPLSHLGSPPNHMLTGTAFLPNSSQHILKDSVTVPKSRVWLLAAQKPIKKPSWGKGKCALFWMLATGIGVGERGWSSVQMLIPPHGQSVGRSFYRWRGLHEKHRRQPWQSPWSWSSGAWPVPSRLF